MTHHHHHDTTTAQATNNVRRPERLASVSTGVDSTTVSFVAELHVTTSALGGPKPDLSRHVERAFVDVVSEIIKVRGYEATGGPLDDDDDGSVHKYAVTVHHESSAEDFVGGGAERLARWITRAVGQALLLGTYHTCVSHVVLISSDDHVQLISRDSVGWVPCSAAAEFDGPGGGGGGGRCTCATYRDMWAMEDRKKHLLDVLMPEGVAGVEKTEDVRPETRALLYKLLAWMFQGYSPEYKCDRAHATMHDLSLPLDITTLDDFMPKVMRMCRCGGGHDRDEMWDCQVAEEPAKRCRSIRRMHAWYDAMPESVRKTKT